MVRLIMGDRWELITVGAETFEMLVKRPTLTEVLAEQQRLMDARDDVHAAMNDRTESRLEFSVADWRGLEDESGQPLAFTRDNLFAVLGHSPDIRRQVLDLVSRIWDGGPPKNSERPSSAGSAKTELTIEAAD